MVGLALLWGLYGAFTGVFDEVMGMGYDRSGISMQVSMTQQTIKFAYIGAGIS